MCIRDSDHSAKDWGVLGRPQSFAISAMSLVNEVKGDVEDWRGVGDCADTEEVDAGLGVRPRNRQRQSPRCLDLHQFTRSLNGLDGGPDQVDGHVVAQQEPRTRGHGFERLSRGGDLDLYVHGAYPSVDIQVE